MATLTRPHAPAYDTLDVLLNSSVPKPFPSDVERERMLREELLEELANEEISLLENDAGETDNSQPEALSGPHKDAPGDTMHEIVPSIAYVQKSCLMILNNLLSAPTKWHPIVPERRHSMPEAPSTTQTDVDASSFALQTLVTNLRNRESGEVMAESRVSENETALLHELRTRLERIASTLDINDAILARTLVSLLSHFNRLSVIQSTVPTSRPSTSCANNSALNENAETVDVFDQLKKQLSSLQLERLARPDSAMKSGSKPVLVVETALLWSKIDEDLENVVSMCKERTDGLPRFSMSDHLPPQYDHADDAFDTPPEYEHWRCQPCEDTDVKSRSGLQSISSVAGSNEKMRLDLEAVTMAIDRLYRVAPQLSDQRVELNTSKLEQMERARQAGVIASRSNSKGKQKERDIGELENILDMLGRASARKITDQSFVLDGGMNTQLEKARTRDHQKRNAFAEQLLQHSNTGRLHGQDAVFQPPRSKDPDALLTLPEFIRESVPHSDSIKMADPEAKLSLPEFIREPVPEHVTVKATRLPRLRSGNTLRSRSMSAPPLSWLLHSTSRSSGMCPETKTQRMSRHGSSRLDSGADGFSVHYVAENHENLHHLLVFLSVTGVTPGTDVEAEVLPSSPDGEQLIIKNGLNVAVPLSLPGRAAPGKAEVKVQSGHYEVKLASPTSCLSSGADSTSLLDASQLSAANPTSFICASCSLPIVQSCGITNYRDLPSEHWEELVDAWMCHADQTLHDHIARHGRGFWPEPGEALVGGSYILFEESSVVKIHLCPAEQSKRGDWHLIRCLCGSVSGRCQEHHSPTGTTTIVYRLLKYAIRPVSPTAEPLKIPLSAFIVEDMTEFVHAHATYRFIILDDEDERPRLLIWLFKPSIRIAYATPTSYTMPRSRSIHAAKVLFKILGPSDSSHDLKSILNKYPGFPQAEYLFYPISICHQLAALLKESNTAYPEGLRTMTGLDVGWLHRG